MPFQKSSIIGLSHIDYTGVGQAFHPCAMTGAIANSVAADVIRTMKGSGSWKLKNLTVYTADITKVGTSTFEIYHNGASSALSHSWTETGSDNAFHTDASEVTLAADDTICFRTNTPAGGGSLPLRMASCELETLTGPLIYILQAGGNGLFGAGTYYVCPGGGLITSATEAHASFRCRAPGVVRGLQVTLDNTIASDDFVVTLRKNGVNTGMTVSVGATQYAIDTTHTVRVANGDLLTYHVSSGSGADVRTMSIIVESDSYQSDIVNTGTKSYTGATATHYGKCYGNAVSDFSTTDAENKWKIPFDTRIGRLRVYFSNSVSGTGTMTLRVNGVASALTLPISVGASGWRETSISTFIDVSADDELDLVFDHSGFTGAFSMIGMTLNYDPSGRRPRVGIN